MSVTLMDRGWRPYQSGTDWGQLLELLVAAHTAGLADSEFTSSGLRALLASSGVDVARFTRMLVDDSGNALAFGVLWRGRILAMLVHPDAHGRVEEELLAWATGVAGRASGVLVRDDNALVIDLLQSRGMTQTGQELRMVRNLGAPIPEPSVPDGFTIDTLHGNAELSAWVNLYNHAFGDTDVPGPTTVDRWQSKLQDPEYDPSLNIVVRNADGRLVAMCFCSTLKFENERLPVKQGRTEPIATHALCRKKGLATAAILTGLRRLRDAGMDEALLTTDADNHAAHRLYRSLGYQNDYNALWYFYPGE